MSAGKKNPFIIGFAVVMVLGVGALGYLTYSAAEEHSKARATYEDEAAELNRLQSAKPFPNDEHLKKFQAQRDEMQVKVDGLQKELSALKIPVEDISPTGFQDKLRDVVGRVISQAAESNVELPDKFYMGMATYQEQPPKGPAAPALYRELRALEAIMNLVIEVKNVKLAELTREPLKEEQDPKPVATPPGKRAPEPEGRKLVEKDSFTLKFSTTQENFQRILNGIVTHKEQFFIPRYLVIANEKPEAPVKEVAAVQPAFPPGGLAENSADPNAANPATAPGAAAPAAAAPAPPGVPGNPAAPAAPGAPAGPKLEYIFGKELVSVTMDIDLVDVKAPEPKSNGKPDAKSQPKK